MELIRQLGIEVSREVSIPEEHQAIVKDRIEKSTKNPERLQDWEKVQDRFNLERS